MDIEPLGRLMRLCLRGNNLKSVSRQPLRRSKQLDKLDIGDNFISEIHQIFNGSLAVRDLNLDSNNITQLNDSAFLGTNAGRIILALNKIENISDAAFLGLENTLEYLDLDRNSIQSFPSAVSRLKKLKYLYMPGNKILEIDKGAFSNFSMTLKAVSLAGNQLSQIPQEALSKCIKLTHLNLGYNLIGELNSEDFVGWGEYVDTLLLQNNRIIRLGNNLFNNTPHLRELSLSFNRLIDVETDAFIDVSRSLESLEISFGLHRDDFPEDFVRPLTSLGWLALDNNNIRLISKSALNTFEKLQYLNLESNRLTDIPVGLFNGSVHGNLRDIRLSYNHINKLESFTFYYLVNLQSIIMAGNNIRAIHSSSFNSLPKLMKVILSQNRISFISPGAFVHTPQLTRLDLQMNELRELSLNIFDKQGPNLTFSFNISRNEISALTQEDWRQTIKVSVLDASHNKLIEVPVQFLNTMSGTLTKLNLGYNTIYQIHPLSFANLTKLETLNLQHNGILSIKRKAFYGLDSLQILDLSHNHLKSLQVSQFSNCPSLRIISLSSNHLRSLPREVFQNTRLEGLDLSNNGFVVFPNQALGDVGFTLRHLDLSYNQIDRIDSTMFHETQFLSHLNLCRNKLNILSDNVFTSLGNLLNLKLCRNALTANFKELLHYIPRLRHLDLSHTGMKIAPVFPLSKLNYLNLTGNYLEELPTNSIESLPSLKTIILRGNRLTSLPSSCWQKLPLLKYLDASSNPIKVSLFYRKILM